MTCRPPVRGRAGRQCPDPPAAHQLPARQHRPELPFHAEQDLHRGLQRQHRFSQTPMRRNPRCRPFGANYDAVVRLWAARDRQPSHHHRDAFLRAVPESHAMRSRSISMVTSCEHPCRTAMAPLPGAFILSAWPAWGQYDPDRASHFRVGPMLLSTSRPISQWVETFPSTTRPESTTTGMFIRFPQARWTAPPPLGLQQQLPGQRPGAADA